MTDSNGAHDSLVLERALDAPVKLVWQMWTDPEHFKAWYGPDGASIPVAEFDVRVGGTRRVCMEVAAPNGTMRIRCTGEHLEIDRPARLVSTESMTDEHGNPMSPDGHPTSTEVHIELETVAGKTLMRLTTSGSPPGRRGRQDGRWRSTSSRHISRQPLGGSGVGATGPGSSARCAAERSRASGVAA
jgi:uncharacterized protein YndB with AHSA1/START domain